MHRCKGSTSFIWLLQKWTRGQVPFRIPQRELCVHGGAPDVAGEKYSLKARFGIDTKDTDTNSTFFILFFFFPPRFHFLIGDEIPTPEVWVPLHGEDYCSDAVWWLASFSFSTLSHSYVIIFFSPFYLFSVTVCIWNVIACHRNDYNDHNSLTSFVIIHFWMLMWNMKYPFFQL